MELTWKNIPLKEKKLTFSISLEEINGLTGNTVKELWEYLTFRKTDLDILMDKKKLNPEEKQEKRRKTVYLEENSLNKYFQKTVYEAMYYDIRSREIILKDPKKKILDSLKIVGLPEKILDHNLKILSSSERALVQLAMALLSNPDILWIEEPFLYLDKTNKKKLILLFRRMTEQYHKTIVWISEDVDMLYQYTKHISIIQNNKIIGEGITKEVMTQADKLKKNKIPLPEMVELTDLIKAKKNISIDYHRDIRDIIKDIYKHV